MCPPALIPEHGESGKGSITCLSGSILQAGGYAYITTAIRPIKPFTRSEAPPLRRMPYAIFTQQSWSNTTYCLHGKQGLRKKRLHTTALHCITTYTGLLVGPHKCVRFRYQGSANNTPKLIDG